MCLLLENSDVKKVFFIVKWVKIRSLVVNVMKNNNPLYQKEEFSNVVHNIMHCD